MLGLILTLILSLLPFKEYVNHLERTCFGAWSHLINWRGSPIVMCQVKNHELQSCDILNPFDTHITPANNLLRIFVDDNWLMDFYPCRK